MAKTRWHKRAPQTKQVSVYVVSAKNERLCISPTMSKERLQTANQEGWKVYKFQLEETKDGLHVSDQSQEVFLEAAVKPPVMALDARVEGDHATLTATVPGVTALFDMETLQKVLQKLPDSVLAELGLTKL